MGFVDSQFGTTVHSCKEKGSVSLSFLPLPCVEERRKCPSSRLCSRLVAVVVLTLSRTTKQAAAETPLLLASHHQLEGARRPESTPVEDSYR